MKQLKSLLPVLFAAALLFVTACGGDATKDDTTTDTSTAGTTDTAVIAANTIVTTPQSMVIVTHKVSNFQKWLESYDAHDSMRLANGLHSYVIGRGLQDSNMIFVAVKADDMEKAKSFGKSPSLRQAMQKGGVVGTPTMSYLTTTWQDTSDLSNVAVRSRTMMTVKDWSTWERNFIDGREERRTNGIVDRAYGFEAGDSTKVTLVTAVTDTAKAFTYYKSDGLKKRREAGGVIGEPRRFLFYVVKRY